MQSVCLAEPGVSASGSLEEETTLIGLTFGGYLRSKVRDVAGISVQIDSLLSVCLPYDADNYWL